MTMATADPAGLFLRSSPAPSIAPTAYDKRKVVAMSQPKRSTDIRQLPLDFEGALVAAEQARALAIFGGYAIERQFLGLLNEAMRRALVRGKKALTVAAEICELLGITDGARHCSEAMLRNYLGQSEDKAPYRFPAAWLPAFCAVTDDDEPLRYLARVRGYELVPAEILALAKIGELRVRRDELTAEERTWKKKLEAMGGGR